MRIKLALLAFAAFALVACGEDTPTIGGQPEGQPEQAPAAGDVTVTAVEYKFHVAPEELAPGAVTFTLENTGEETHEFSLSRITTDATVEELLDLPEKEATSQLEDAGRVFAKPGATDSAEMTLEPGRYGYVCFEPSADGTPHAFLGMYGELTVA